MAQIAEPWYQVILVTFMDMLGPVGDMRREYLQRVKVAIFLT